MKILLLTIILLLLAGLGWFFTRPAVPHDYVDDYHRALKTFLGSTSGIERGLQRFTAAYANLAHPDLADRVGQLYAETLYFNDSLRSFSSRDALVEYMGGMSQGLAESKVEVEQVMRDGHDVYVRWSMHFRVAGDSKIESRSIGMSHLRFDADGRVVLHQDFWDAASGLYRNLPVVGFALKQVDRRMHQ